MRYLKPEQLLAAAHSAIKPSLLVTMACTLTVAVVLYGFFAMLAGGSSTGGGAAIFWRFVGGATTLLWTLFGLTALARQLWLDMRGEAMPNTKGAMCFAWSRMRSLIMLPAWAAGALLALLVAEMAVLLLARIPGLGLVWLALIGIPLLLLNTLVALGLLLALFNIAARVAMSDADANTLRDTLWRLLRERFTELAIYNLGGALATALIAAIVLSPLWLGLEITWGLAHIAAGSQMAAVLAASGFWGGIAHLLALALAGALLAAVASVPGIVITHMTLLVHRELDATQAETTPEPTETPVTETTESAQEAPSTDAKPKATRRRKTPSSTGKATRKRAGTSRSRKKKADEASQGDEPEAAPTTESSNKTGDDEASE